MNKVVSSEIKYFHKEKTMNAEKWEKSRKGSLYTIVSIGTSKKGEKWEQEKQQ
ncbi:hypothetical protein NXX71_18945 [Bacteroides faecis]|nr:hypothetical protein [Bacteroides faecis]